jgi:hypothetical protein
MSRVIKVGALTAEKIIAAIQNPVSVQIRGTRYTFTDFRRFGTENEPNGIFARLAKYKLEGAVEVVHPDVHTVGREAIENLMEASSPFVYLPEFSGIAYKHVWNFLERNQFARAFCELIEASEQSYFGRCELEPVTDLRTFVARLSKLEKVTVLQAKVKPPNPLFGPCWEQLKEYMKTRHLEEVGIKEESSAGISTKVTQIAAAMADGSKSAEELREMMEPLLNGVGDAALLMAADGYGSGRVVGVETTRTVTIRTSENQKSFILDRDRDPEELYNVAYEQFSKINNERYLEHP